VIKLYTLYIDTHFKDVVLVLYKGNSILKIIEKKECEKISRFIIPYLKKLFLDMEISLNDVDKIIVCNGPGSFTGIRIAVTIAKTISYSLSIPIYTINYLEVSAMNNKGKCTFGVKENNGYYKANFNDNKMISDIVYVKGNEYQDTIFNDNIDYNLLLTYPYLKKTDCYNANPLYVKVIEALDDKKNGGK